ncbi:MAG TPA: hypothetical protein VMM27_14365 [Casimicrobiaceae bacterium]|nr:hypothetical protein [Casimicrobiaceae bacterium]
MNLTPRGDAHVRLGTLTGRPGPDRRSWVIRPDDLLVLDFAPINLAVKPAEGDMPAQLAKSGAGQAYLVVTFPPQNIAEQAYFTTAPEYPVSNGLKGDPDAGSGDEPPDLAPIQAVVSGWSRLVFRVPDDRLPIAWSLESLLEAMRTLELSVPANALPPTPKRFGAERVLGPLLETATRGKFAFAAAAGADAKQTVGAKQIISALRPDAGVVAASRARRQLRVAAYALGITDATGSATIGLHDALVESVVGTGIKVGLMRPEPRAPSQNETSLELPYEVFLSPHRLAAWLHAATPVTSPQDGHTELWHTRLGARQADGTGVEGPTDTRTVRAVWTTAGLAPSTPKWGEDVNTPGHANFPYRMSMDAFDKHNVVHLSSNFRLQDPAHPKRYYEPEPIDVKLLALSSLGAWLDSRGVWDGDLPGRLSVEEWRHRATLGRDHYVRIVYRGRLFPWGHRASVVKVTERQFEPTLAGNPAYLRQRMFLVVKEPLRMYGSIGLLYDGPDPERQGEKIDLMLPFQRVRITTVVSPLLDPPETDHIAGKMQGCFWPNVGGKPFQFHLVGTDMEGNDVDFTMPLIFVGKEETDPPYASSIVPDDVVTKYESDTWPGSAQKRSQVQLFGQKVALAKSGDTDDTTFAVQSITFGAFVPQEPTYNDLPTLEPRFFPILRSAEIDVPALQAIARTTAPASVVYAAPYLLNEFAAGNEGEVFLARDPAQAALEVKFSDKGDRSGGLVTPDLSMSGVSRITGPISGDLGISAAGSFSPNAWFGAIAGAKLFGVLKLSDILHDVGFDELDKLPRFVGQALNQVESLLSDLVRLRERLAVDSVPDTGAVTFLLNQLTDPDTGSIPALLDGGTVATVVSQLASLNTELDTLRGKIGASALPSGVKAVVAQSLDGLQTGIGDVLAKAELLTEFAAGGDLPRALRAHLEWRPQIKQAGPFVPSGDRNLVLAVDAAGDAFSVTCSLDHFTIDIEVLALHFDRVQFRSVAGKKPEVDVVFTGFEFKGPLSFVQTLKELIPFNGFSDPPDVQVTAKGITAGFSVGLPNIAVGVFSLENLSLAAGFNVPFIGPPLNTWFRFCERENPARLTVSLFGGGFFFGLTADASGLTVLEGAIEFGAAASVDFGVASGSVSVMAGLYFKIEGSDFTLAGYFRMRGEVEALGLVSVSIELYLEMRYESASGKCTGTATISIEIEVAMFSTTISISCTKKFAGGNNDPTLAELLDVAPDATSADWNAYCEAFA